MTILMILMGAGFLILMALAISYVCDLRKAHETQGTHYHCPVCGNLKCNHFWERKELK